METVNQGPAERLVQAFLTHGDHMVHNRPGIVCRDATSPTGVKWSPVTYKVEDTHKVVYRKDQNGAKTNLVKLGVLQDDGRVLSGNAVIGQYMQPGLFKEVAVWMYRQVAELWKLDNEFAARWASYAYTQDHKDRKVVLAAFMMVQSRKGDPILDNGTIAFHDDDFRDVGEAMALQASASYMDAKQILRMWDLLSLPEIAAVNRELGFGNSARRAFLGRLPRTIEKWLLFREENPKLLNGLVKNGHRTALIRLARLVGYKPTTPNFFKALRWKQVQAKDGRRTLAIGEAVSKAESWAELTEEQICERIVKTKPNYKRIVGLLPESVGLTRAIMAAAIEAGALSDKDLIMYTPTLEELGLLKVPAIQGRWQKANEAASDQRAANIALRVKSKEAKEALQDAADTAVKKAVEVATRGVRTYFIVDVSSSMNNAIAAAKLHIAKFLQGFPLERLHVAVFNTSGRELEIKHASAAGVENAFRGISASGGTSHAAGVKALQHRQPQADEDVLFFFVGDEEENGTFDQAVQTSGLRPTAFAMLKVRENPCKIVQTTAAALGIPCFMVDEKTFADTYAIPRTIQALIASTPVGMATAKRAAPRLTLVEAILKTPLLQKPAWAA
jgi:hypothetical protein